MDNYRERKKNAMREFVSAYRAKGYHESALMTYGILAGCRETLLHFDGDIIKAFNHFTMLVNTCESEQAFTDATAYLALGDSIFEEDWQDED